MTSTYQSNRGFSLLEVMIAVAILSFALLSLAALQTTLIRSSSDTKARSSAATLAQAQLDRFRSIQQQGSLTGTLAYADIISGTLGDDSIFGGTSTEFPAGKITQSNVEFGASWNVVDYWFDEDSQAFTVTDPDPNNTPTPDYKRIEMTVSWTDENGQLQAVVLEDIVPKTTPKESGLAYTDDRGFAQGPLVGYVPQPAPEVVRVPTLGVGGGRFKETSKPLPDVLRNDFSTITTFSTITFDENDDGSFTALRQEDFFVVNCVCEFATEVISETEPYQGSAPTVWDGSEYTGGQGVAGKSVGARADDFLGGQPQLCNTCCKDHHDKTNEDPPLPLYDPFRPTLDYNANGNHNHYFANEAGQLVIADETAGNLYFEACRFIRKDGLLQVAQDFNLEALNLMPATQLQSTAGLAAYQSYVVDFVEDYVTAAVALGDSYPASRPDTSAFDAQFTADSVALSDLPVQMLSRGVYVDYMTSDLLQCIRNRAGVGVNDDTPINCLPEAGGPLDITPFYEVNVTRLANWSYEGNVFVTDEPIADGTEETYSRGLATVNPLGATDTTVNVSMEAANSGLTDTRAIDIDDAANNFADSLVIVDAADSDTIVITGSLALAGQISSVTPSDITIDAVRIVVNPLTGDVTVTAIEDPMLCIKPTDDTIRCEIAIDDPLVPIQGLGLRISGYSDEFQQGNNLVLENNSVCSTSGIVGDRKTLGDGSSEEFTLLRFVDLLFDQSGTAGANQYRLDLNAKRQGANRTDATNCPDLTPIVVVPSV